MEPWGLLLERIQVCVLFSFAFLFCQSKLLPLQKLPLCPLLQAQARSKVSVGLLPAASSCTSSKSGGGEPEGRAEQLLSLSLARPRE